MPPEGQAPGSWKQVEGEIFPLLLMRAASRARDLTTFLPGRTVTVTPRKASLYMRALPGQAQSPAGPQSMRTEGTLESASSSDSRLPSPRERLSRMRSAQGSVWSTGC